MATTYTSPYWSSFFSNNLGKSWTLKIPTNISPRHGIAYAQSSSGDSAWAFFPYQDQKNSVVFEVQRSGLLPPIFSSRPILSVRQPMAFSVHNLFVLVGGGKSSQIVRYLGGKNQVVAQSPTRSSEESASAIGFDVNNPSKGAALIDPQVTNKGIMGIWQTSNSGASWTEISTLSSNLGRIVASYVPMGFGSNAFEVAVTFEKANTYQTVVVSSSGVSKAIESQGLPIVGGDPLGNIYLMDSILGGSSLLHVYGATKGAWLPPISTKGVGGAIEAVSFSSIKSGVILASVGGNVVSFLTNDGGSSWKSGGSLSLVANPG